MLKVLVDIDPQLHLLSSSWSKHEIINI